MLGMYVIYCFVINCFVINRLQESKNQNEQVFHELIPSLETLEPAPGMRMSLSFL